MVCKIFLPSSPKLPAKEFRIAEILKMRSKRGIWASVSLGKQPRLSWKKPASKLSGRKTEPGHSGWETQPAKAARPGGFRASRFELRWAVEENLHRVVWHSKCPLPPLGPSTSEQTSRIQASCSDFAPAH